MALCLGVEEMEILKHLSLSLSLSLYYRITSPVNTDSLIKCINPIRSVVLTKSQPFLWSWQNLDMTERNIAQLGVHVTGSCGDLSVDGLHFGSIISDH